MPKAKKAEEFEDFCHDLDQFHQDDKESLKPFVCPINLGVFNDPITAVCCGNTLCKSCFLKSYNTNGSCPLCRKNKIDVKQIIVILSLRNFINSKKIICPNSSMGCQWVEKLDSLKSHQLNDCEYTNITCTHCKIFVLKKDFLSHTSDCPEKPIECLFCKKVEAKKHLEVKN